MDKNSAIIIGKNTNTMCTGTYQIEIPQNFKFFVFTSCIISLPEITKFANALEYAERLQYTIEYLKDIQLEHYCIMFKSNILEYKYRDITLKDFLGNPQNYEYKPYTDIPTTCVIKCRPVMKGSHVIFYKKK